MPILYNSFRKQDQRENFPTYPTKPANQVKMLHKNHRQVVGTEIHTYIYNITLANQIQQGAQKFSTVPKQSLLQVCNTGSIFEIN